MSDTHGTGPAHVAGAHRSVDDHGAGSHGDAEDADAPHRPVDRSQRVALALVVAAGFVAAAGFNFGA